MSDGTLSRYEILGKFKPANVMVTSSGLVKLLDFGLARLVHAGSAR